MSDTPKIHTQMVAIMRGVEVIRKDKQSKGIVFDYRGIDDFYNELHQLFADNGVFIASEIVESERFERDSKLPYVTILTMRFHFFAEDGSSMSAVTQGEGMDNGDKGTAKAMSVAMKYCLMQTFLVPTEDLVDGDAESIPPRDKPKKAKTTTPDPDHEERAELRKEINASREECGWSVEEMFAAINRPTPKECTTDELKLYAADMFDAAKAAKENSDLPF